MAYIQYAHTPLPFYSVMASYANDPGLTGVFVSLSFKLTTGDYQIPLQLLALLSIK